MRAAAGDSEGAAKQVLHAVPELDALLSTEDDGLVADDDLPGARFELKSVLVAN